MGLFRRKKVMKHEVGIDIDNMSDKVNEACADVIERMAAATELMSREEAVTFYGVLTSTCGMGCSGLSEGRSLEGLNAAHRDTAKELRRCRFSE